MSKKFNFHTNGQYPTSLVSMTILLGLMVSMLGCDYISLVIDPRLLTPIAPTSTSKSPTTTPRIIATDVPILPTSSPEVGQPTLQSTSSCAFVWSSQPLPDVSNQIQISFNAVGLAKIKVLAEAYGEVCLNTETNETGNLIVLHTDFNLDIPVDSIQDEEKLGQLLYSSLNILAKQNASALPGKRMGYVTAKFHSADKKELNLRFPLETGMKAVEKGLRGVELFQALSNQ